MASDPPVVLEVVREVTENREKVRRDVTGVSLPSGVTARPARLEDSDAAEDLVNRCTRRDIDLVLYGTGDLRRGWTKDGCEHHVVLERDGRLVGLLGMEPDPREPELYLDIYVDPEAHETSLVRSMIDLGLRTADEMVAARSADVRVSTDAVDEEHIASLLEAGFRVDKRYVAMFFDLDRLDEVAPGGGPAPSFRTYVPGRDDALMFGTMRAAFGSDWDGPVDPARWIERSQKDPSYSEDLWFFAWSNERVVGAVQCLGRWHGDERTGWVRNLGVLPDARKTGVGRALLYEAFRRLRRHGCERVVLGVDRANPTDARNFYLRAGMYEGATSVDLKILRTARGSTDRR